MFARRDTLHQGLVIAYGLTGSIVKTENLEPGCVTGAKVASDVVTTNGTQTLMNKTLGSNNHVALYKDEQWITHSGVNYTLPTTATQFTNPRFINYEVKANEVLEVIFSTTTSNNPDAASRYIDARIYVDGVEQLNRVSGIHANTTGGQKEYASVEVAIAKLYTVDTTIPTITFSLHAAATTLIIYAGSSKVGVRRRAATAADFSDTTVQFS